LHDLRYQNKSYFLFQPNRNEIHENIDKLLPGKPWYFSLQESQYFSLQEDLEACMLLSNEKFEGEPLFISQVYSPMLEEL